MKHLHFIMLAVTAVLFFASCEKKGSKSTPIKWSGDLSQIVFKRNDGRHFIDAATYIGTTPYPDYKYMKWADNYTYTGECPTNETLVFTANEWGDYVSRTLCKTGIVR